MQADIIGFENYQITDDGRVWSKKRNKWRTCILGDKGYLKVNLSKDGKVYTKNIHRLVAEAFIPNPENKNCVDHINTIRTDNRVENLKWVSYTENMNNPISLHGMTGENNWKSKTVYQYTTDNVLLNTFCNARDAAEKTNSIQSCICRCCLGKRKIHNGFKWSFEPLKS